jgi:hypothetical protein
MLDDIQHATGNVYTGGVYPTTHTVRKRTTSSTPWGLSKNCRFSYTILEALKFTGKQMYLFPRSVENNKQSDRKKCDPREKNRCRILKRTRASKTASS